MALVTRTICGSQNTELSYTFDDQTKVIRSVTLVNTGSFGTLTLTLRDPNTQAIVYQRSQPFGAGTLVDDVSSHNWLMVQSTITGPHGTTTGWVLPVLVQCNWSST